MTRRGVETSDFRYPLPPNINFWMVREGQKKAWSIRSDRVSGDKEKHGGLVNDDVMSECVVRLGYEWGQTIGI